jgi:hypothetical protein
MSGAITLAAATTIWKEAEMSIAGGVRSARVFARRRPRRGWHTAAALVSVLGGLMAVWLPATASASTDLGPVSFGTIVVDDATQDAFVSSPSANAVYEFDSNGNLIATVPNVYGAWGMTINGSYLYVAESTAGAIVRIDLTAATLSPQTIATGLNGPNWLVLTGGELWSTQDVNEGQSDTLVSIDPNTGVTTTLPGTYYEPDLAVSPGDPSTLFVAEDGLSPGTIYRFAVSASPPTRIADVSTDQENIGDLVVSPDGTRVIPASGSPYLFEELSASTLKPDGLKYPGNPYPSAVAVSGAGLLATGLSNSRPDIAVYRLGTPAPLWTASTNSADGAANVLPHGLALSADGKTLFVVTGGFESDTRLSVLTSSSSSTPTPTPTPTPTKPKPPKPGSKPKTPPFLLINPKHPLSTKPDVSLELGAIRESLVSRATHRVVGYRYFFSAQDIHCVDGATNVLFTVGRTRHCARCTPGPILVSGKLAPHRTYRIHVQAVKMHKRRIVSRGTSYSGRLHMPGNEVHWSSIAKLPPTL